jgi:tetratricopeptide (TPR) repeat protein
VNRIEQLIRDGDTHRNNGQGLKAVAAYREAARLAAEAGEWSQAAAAQHMLGVAYKVENNIDAALAELHRALPLYERAHDPDGAGRVARDLGIAYDYRGQYTEGEPWLQRSVDALKSTANLPELGISEAKLGLHYLQTGHLAQAERWIDRGLATIRRSHNWFYEMTALLHRATLRLAQHRPADAIADLTAAQSLIEQAGESDHQHRRLAQIHGLLAQAYFQQADRPTARGHYRQATDLLTPMPANVAAVIRADINADELDRLLSN